MDMVRSDAQRMEIPFSNLACFSHGLFNAPALRCIKDDDFSIEPFRIGF